jgi:uncharacterized C2H2 Zn-finger protein
MLKLTDEQKLEFDFGEDRKDQNGNSAEAVDFTGKESVGKCPKCGGRVFEHGMNYVCEHAVGKDRTCDFRTGKIILQQEITSAQMSKLLATGKTDLLDKIVSKKTGRAFKAFLALGKDGKVGFEFEKREPKTKGGKAQKSKEPPRKLDFTGQEPIGKCPKCGANVFESEADYICEKSQAEAKPCKFKTGKVILQQPVDRAQVVKLLTTGKTDLLPRFVSAKTGRPFSAYLVLGDDKKVGFDFPPREDSAATS